MSMMPKSVRQTLTVARRDFIATVFTPTFLLFLLAPLLMIGFGAVGGLGAASMAGSTVSKMRIAVVTDPVTWRKYQAADTELRKAFRRADAPPQLIFAPESEAGAAQANRTMARTDVEVIAAIFGSPATPTVLYRPTATRSADYLTVLAEWVMRADRSGGATALSRATKREVARIDGVATASGTNQAAFFSVFGLFILTLMLAGQAVGTMAEERSNKVIEVLAAAVPLESVFLGKLIGMFGVAILFVGFWGTIAVNIGQMMPPNLARAFAASPAVGPAFPLLFFAYFTMAYLLLGAVFLGIGAQASTPREIQMLSLPITIFQVAMFSLSQVAAAQPTSTIARIAEIFPFSSPFAMAARAANSPELWPHLLALAWQLGWVAATVWIGARLFRRGVLQSGSPGMKFWKRGGTAKALEAGGRLPI